LASIGKYAEALEFTHEKISSSPVNQRKQLTDLADQIEAMKHHSVTGEYDYASLHTQNPMGQRLATCGEYNGPYEVRKVTGKGRGLFATRDIQPGELILASRAEEIIFYCDCDETSEIKISHQSGSSTLDTGSHEDTVAALCRRIKTDPQVCKKLYSLDGGLKFRPLSQDQIDKRYLSTASNVDPVDMERIANVVRNNSFRYAEFGNPVNKKSAFESPFDSQAAAFWILPSYMNHDCGNANANWLMLRDFFFSRATRLIPKGEEITTLYVCAFSSLKDRDKVAKSHGFVCKCR